MTKNCLQVCYALSSVGLAVIKAAQLQPSDQYTDNWFVDDVLSMMIVDLICYHHNYFRSWNRGQAWDKFLGTLDMLWVLKE